jgi:hypothetical protein
MALQWSIDSGCLSELKAMSAYYSVTRFIYILMLNGYCVMLLFDQAVEFLMEEIDDITKAVQYSRLYK